MLGVVFVKGLTNTLSYPILQVVPIHHRGATIVIEDLVPGQVTPPVASSAWIEPDGKFHFVPTASHSFVARMLGATDSQELEEQGWVHFSFTGVHHLKPLSQSQMDSLFDCMMSFEATPKEERDGFHRDHLVALHKALDPHP